MKPSFDRVFKALADPTRIRIVNLLAEGELCVCDMMKILRMGQSKVSRHLAYLKSAGLVEGKKHGLWRYYTLARSDSLFHKKLLDCLSTCFDEALIFKKDEALLRKLRKTSSRC